MDDLNIAAVCMRAEPGRIERNLDRIRSLSLEAAAQGADMACFPELSVTGYSLTDPESLSAGWEFRELTGSLVKIAEEANMVILAGLAEARKGAPPYIAQVVAGPEGLMGVHRKTHLSPMERKAFSPGEDLTVFVWRHTTFGI